MIEMIQSISSINKYTNEQDCTRCKTNGCRMKHYLQINIVCSHSQRLRCFLAAALHPCHIKCNLLRRRLKARSRTTFVFGPGYLRPAGLSLVCVESASRASFSFFHEYKNTHTIVRYFTDTTIFTSHTPPETKRTLIRTHMVPCHVFCDQKYVLPPFHARGDRFPDPSSSANSTACTTHTQHTYKSQNMIFPDTFVRAPREQTSRERSPSGKRENGGALGLHRRRRADADVV
jgi:hypothetical protein